MTCSSIACRDQCFIWSNKHLSICMSVLRNAASCYFLIFVSRQRLLLLSRIDIPCLYGPVFTYCEKSWEWCIENLKRRRGKQFFFPFFGKDRGKQFGMLAEHMPLSRLHYLVSIALDGFAIWYRGFTTTVAIFYFLSII